MAEHSPFPRNFYSIRHRAFRALWMLSWALFAAWTPSFWSPWRILLLRVFGARIAKGAAISPSCKIWYPPNLVIGKWSTLGPGVNCYNMASIELGDSVIISQGAFLCAGTHDVDDPHFALVTRPISIHSRAWIAAGALIGPGVTVGEGAVLGAHGVAFADLEPWQVYAGNPARQIRARSFAGRDAS